MEVDKIIEFVSCRKADYIFELLKEPDLKEILHEAQINPLQRLV